MNALSPFTQRVVAVGILVLLMLIGIQFASVVGGAVSAELEALAASRVRLDRLNALNSLPATASQPVIAPDLYFSDRTKVSAISHFSDLILRSAARVGLQGVQSSQTSDEDRSPQRLALNVQVTGSADAVQAFVYEVERARPAVRFRSIEMAVSPTGDQLRLTAVATSVWVAAK